MRRDQRVRTRAHSVSESVVSSAVDTESDVMAPVLLEGRTSWFSGKCSVFITDVSSLLNPVGSFVTATVEKRKL